MKKLYVMTDKEELEIKDIKEEDIDVGERFIAFGKTALVNLNNFVSYQFVEIEENE